MNAAQHLADFELSYTLSKQIPAMECGFVIQTVYGEIHVGAGHLAGLIQNLVAQEFRLENRRREASAVGRDAAGFRIDAVVIGEGLGPGVRRPVAQPVGAACAGKPGAADRVPAALAGLPATTQTAGDR